MTTIITGSFFLVLDASVSTNLAGDIKKAFETKSLIVVRNLTGAMGGRLSAYEYTNLIKEIGRVWSTADELAAESRFQLKDYPEIIKITHDGLLGNKLLPIHSDGSHHPSRPWPGRALLPVILPKDSATVTKFYDLYSVVDEVSEWFEDNEYVSDPNDIRCWHQPAYGTGWAGRWNRLFEIHPRTGQTFVAFDETFIRRIVCKTNEWTPEEVASEKVEVADIIRNQAQSYEHQWLPTDLLLWDNRGLAHSRTAISSGEQREMWRITFDMTW
jgi:hypothetical protein